MNVNQLPWVYDYIFTYSDMSLEWVFSKLSNNMTEIVGDNFAQLNPTALNSWKETRNSLRCQEFEAA